MSSCTLSQDQRRLGASPYNNHRPFPNDVLIDILTRLPVKSLLRSKCVCKNWYDIIQSPNFVQSHFRLQKLRRKARIFLQYFNDIDDVHTTRKFHYALFPDETLASDAFHDLDFLETHRPAFIHGPVDGLFCVFNNEDRYIIWNPAIREFRSLPFPGCPEFPPDLDVVSSANVHSKTGFGFGRSTGYYYKVVLIRCIIYEVKDLPMVNDACVHVYSLKTNTWRHLDSLDCVSQEQLRRSGIGAYSDGFYYWWAGKILAFDMSSEVFRAMSVPFILSSEVDECDVKPYNGDRIALFQFKGLPEDGPEKCCDIWVMEEEGGNWIKQFSVGLIPGIGYQQGLWKNGDLLFLKLIQGPVDCDGHHVCQLVLYNPCAQQLRYVGPIVDSYFCQALVYHESLVPVDSGIHQTKGKLCDSLAAQNFFEPNISHFQP